MKSILLTIFISIFVLLPPYFIHGGGLWYYGDDQDYFAHAASIVYGQFPSYKNEYLTINPQYPQGGIGCSILSLPFTWLFSLVDRAFSSSIVSSRTPDNISISWTHFGFVFSTIFYFSLACFLLFLGASYHIEEGYAVLSVILSVFCQGLPLFALRRPIFSHTAEFFLLSLFIYLILRNSARVKKYPYAWWDYIFLGTCGALIYLTRYNNVGFSILGPVLVLMSAKFDFRSFKNWPYLLIITLSFAMMVGIFKVWPESVNHVVVYQWIKAFLLLNITFADLLHRLGHIFLGLDWGLIYSAPYIIIGFMAAIMLNFPLKKYFLSLVAMLGINFYIVIIWGSQGGWYGYRYLIASAIPIFILPISFLFKFIKTKFKRELFLIWMLIAVPPFLSMVSFEGNETSLNLSTSVQDFGRVDITNNLYQFYVWDNFVMHFQDFLKILYKGGAQYAHYIFILLMQKIGFFSNVFFRHYPSFDAAILIRVLLIYALPFIIYWVLKSVLKLNKI